MKRNQPTSTAAGTDHAGHQDTQSKATLDPSRGVRRTLRLAGWNISGILLMLVLVEIALRLFGIRFPLYPTKIQLGQLSPIVRYSQYTTQYTADRQTFWAPYGYSAKVATWEGREPMIVFMGDSCTESLRYSKFLASLVEGRNSERDFTYVNVGTSGWSSYQGLQQLKRDVIPMRPRVITIYYGWNDHWPNYGLEDKRIGEIYQKHPLLLFELSSRLRMANFVNHLIFAFRYPIPEQHNKSPLRVSLSDFSANLRQMIQIARNNDIVPILLTAPTSHRKGKEPRHLTERLKGLSDLIPLHQQYVQAVRDVAAQHRAHLIDLYTAFNRLPQEDLDRFFRRDGIHLRKEGDEKIAEMMYAYLVDTGLYGCMMELQPK